MFSDNEIIDLIIGAAQEDQFNKMSFEELENIYQKGYSLIKTVPNDKALIKAVNKFKMEIKTRKKKLSASSLSRHNKIITKKRVIAVVVMLFIILYIYACSPWPLYTKPAFCGRVIDAWTKKSIEGAVVVVLYKVYPIISGPGGGSASVMKVKETLTDKKGEFYFPEYITLIGLNSEKEDTEFIIFKPGYEAVNGMGIMNFPDERYFSIEKNMIGKEGTIKYVDTSFTFPATFTWKGLMGIVELKIGENDPSTPTDYRSKELPLLFKAMNEDRRIRGYEGMLK